MVNVNIKGILGVIAPWIGGAVGGPLGKMATDVIVKALDLPESTDDKGLSTALSNPTNDQLLALKRAEQDFELAMKTLGFSSIEKLEALSVADRSDARTMQSTLKSNVPAILTILITIGYFGILGGMLSGYFKTSESQALMILLGSLTTAWVSVISFWFGSTAGSSRKTELLAKAQPME